MAGDSRDQNQSRKRTGRNAPERVAYGDQVCHIAGWQRAVAEGAADI